ncbi:MAG TPA: right-handed parallel beta-helix repeat-containing protein [Steroidobacteraceae bacterium]|nr:right-handed parallel beta-helix repeat-containing protein [Steroidobacteraceae bacterium]
MSTSRLHPTLRCIAALGTLLIARALPAATLHVCPSGCAFTTIQGAIDESVSGDVIDIAAGRYVENIAIIGKRLTLAGDSTGGVTEVIAAARGPTVVLGSGSDGAYDEVDLRNLSISNGNHQTGTGVGGGIQVRRGAFLHLLNSIVMHNFAAAGGGVGVNTPAGPPTVITASLIDDNTSTALTGPGGGGIAVMSGSTVAIQQSAVTRNRAFDGGGIYTDSATHTTIDAAMISENTVSQVHMHLGFVGGIGAGLDVNSAISITGSTIADNAATGQEIAFGGGMFILLGGGAQSVATTVIAHNSATGPGGVGDGGGLFIAAADAHDTLTLNKVYVVENQASPGSAGGVANEGTLLLNGTIIRDNTGVNCEGGSGCPP